MAEQATPIEEQTLAGDGAEHQALLDRLHGVLNGAWQWVESHLPEHELKPQVLNGLKAAYDNGAAAVKADYATLKAQGETLAGEAEADAKTDLTTAEGQAETAVEDAAAAVSSQAASTSTSTTTPSSPATSSATSTGTDKSGS